MKCLICDFENTDESQFCMRCGSRIPRCPTCGRVLTDRDRFCVQDGTLIPEEILELIPEKSPPVSGVEQVILGVQNTLLEEYEPGAFCMNCGDPCHEGEDLCEACKAEQSARQDRPEGRKKKKTGLVEGLILLLLVLIGSIVMGAAISRGDLELPFLGGENDSHEDRDEDKDKNDDDGDTAPVGSGAEQNQSEDTGASEEAESGADVPVATEEPEEEPTEETTEAPTEESVPEETEPKKGTLEYFVTYCDTVYFTEEDLEGFTAEECRIARNACFAHSGRMFNDPQLQAYFEQFDWYEPLYTPENFPSNALNDCQNTNIQLVSAYESEMGYK